MVSAIGFFIGRASLPESPPIIASPKSAEQRNQPESNPSTHRAASLDEELRLNPRTELLRAMRQSGTNRNQAVRLAMNAWLVADGAAAIIAIREDPELAELADAMLQMALIAYPELILEDPSLIRGHSEAEWLVQYVANVLATVDPQVARRIIEVSPVDSSYHAAVLARIEDKKESLTPLSLDDAHAELDSILAIRNRTGRTNRLRALVNRVASDNPEAATELIDRLPRSLSEHIVGSLIFPWVEQNPKAAADWLATRPASESEAGMHMLASLWGNQDFEMASAFADTLKGMQRNQFLHGLVDAAQRGTHSEALAWLSQYEGDPVYLQLAERVFLSIAQEDVYAAVALIDNLSSEVQTPVYASVLPMLAMEDPQAAMRVVNELDSESVRDLFFPTMASIWAEDEPRHALEWAIRLEKGASRDEAMANIATSGMQFDPDSAIEALKEIESSDLQDSILNMCLRLAESDDLAIRLGRQFGIDREAVLELRKKSQFSPYQSMVSLGSTVYSSDSSFISIDEEEEAD